MARMLRPFIFLVFLAGGGCAASPATWLHTWGLDSGPHPGGFTVCTAFSCTATARTFLDPDEWSRVQDLFNPPPGDAADERLAAARAVGLLEAMVGARVGTAGDRSRDDVGGEDEGQLDCIAEAANTTVYLLLMAREGLLPRHRVATPARRGVLVFLAHSTAVLEEQGGAAYAVDSWYGAGGEAARVWPLAAWMAREKEGELTGAPPIRPESGVRLVP